ncbi:phosphatase PAP2 family protein, partial [Bacteroides fragilis]|nr:phosphatase PAP2 family protein [Bacteroides fragilis]
STFAEKYHFNVRRPFQVAPDAIHKYNDGKKDYYGTTPAFPSGHTNQATWITTLMAHMLPEVAPQLVLRGAEAGNHRVVMGVLYLRGKVPLQRATSFPGSTRCYSQVQRR